MALPVDGQPSATYHAAQFLPPRDRPKLFLEDWSRGGDGLNDATFGLDRFDWRTYYVEETRTFWTGVPGVVDDTAIYVTDDLAVEIGASFDTNMQPVIGWETEDGLAFFRWFDPTVPAFVTVPLPAGSYAVRVGLDDHRYEESVRGVTDTIIAYVREGVVYYRLLRERFDTEHLLTGSEGMVYLYQIGMNELLRFQFSRSGVFADDNPNLNLGRPEYRSGGRPLYFDWAGDIALHPNTDLGFVPGKPGPWTYRTRNTSASNTYHVQNEDGSWVSVNRGARARFVQLPSTPLGERRKTWLVDREGTLVANEDEQLGERPLQYTEAAADGKTITGMFRADNGAGITFDVVSITTGPAFGSFTPDYASTDDFASGQAASGAVRFADTGTFVTLSLPAAHAGLSASSQLRWPAGTIPIAQRPLNDRAVSCTVQHSGALITGAALIGADGSAEFWPLQREPAGVLTESFEFYDTSQSWTPPAASVDLLLVGSGANGGAGSGDLGGGGGGGGAVRVMLDVPVNPEQVYSLTVAQGALSPSTSFGALGAATYITGVASTHTPTGGGGSPVGSGGVNGAGAAVNAGSGGGGGAPEGLGGGYVAGAISGSVGGAASTVSGGGGGGADSAGADAVTTVAGNGGDGLTLTDVGFSGASGEGAPTTFAAGGGGGAPDGGTAGTGGSSVGGDGGAPGAGADAVAGTGSGGGGGGGAGVGGRGSGGFIVVRWISGSSANILTAGTFPSAGQSKGLPAGLVLTYAKGASIPLRITEAGDFRITESGDFRRPE